MAVTIDEIQDSFELLYDAFLNQQFTKTLKLKHRTERQLLPLIRTSLLGYFGDSVIPEVAVQISQGGIKKSGRIDFRVDDTAVEFAIRNPESTGLNVSASSNRSEIKKLMKWRDGKSVLVLFDYSKHPYSSKALDKFRTHPSLGKGNHQKNAFTLLYFYLASQKPLISGCVRKNIRRLSKKL